MMKTAATDRIEVLQKKANDLRRDILTMLHEAGSGHPGGCLSAIDILTALYYEVMRVDPKNPSWEDRDRFVLSKGHSCPAVYAVLADLGFFPKAELKYLRKSGHLLKQGSIDAKVPGVEMAGGSLGQGLSAGIGIALGCRYLKKSFRVYVLLGDGEIQEGQVWEAAMAAGTFKLGALTAILDRNRLQCDGPVDEVLTLDPLDAKWEAFGWHVVVIDGHDYAQILNALAAARMETEKPTMILADTVKGKGVSYMENRAEWHGSAVPNAEQLAAALKELERR